MAKKLKIYNRRGLDLLADAKAKEIVKTDKEFCEKVHILQANLVLVKAGSRSFTIDQLMAIAKLTGASMDYICGKTSVVQPRAEKSVIELLQDAISKLKK